jgi:hypothetical protein
VGYLFGFSKRGAIAREVSTNKLAISYSCLILNNRGKQRGETMTETTEKENKYRVQLDFSEEAFNELNDLQKKLNATSRAEVVRNALGVLRWVTNHLSAGNKIVVEKKNGEKSDVEFPFLLVR